MSTRQRRHLADLAETLDKERDLLEYLLFKLVQARLVLAADEARFVVQAMNEVEAVIGQIRFGEAHRSAAVERLAAELGEPSSRVTLGYLAERSPEPYRSIFRRHRERFQELASEIEQVTVDNRRLAALTLENLDATLGALMGGASYDTYTAQGRRDHVTGGPASSIERNL